MRVFQLVIAVISALMTIGMFAFNLWVDNRYKVSGTAKCYIPLNIITSALVLIVIVTVLLKK